MNTELRVGDAERDEVTAALHEHFAQGRLTRDELDERLTATLSARTVGDLRKVTRDLPGATPDRLPAGRPSGPWEMGAAHWGRGPSWRHGGWGPPRGGWGPRRGRPFGPILLVALVVAAFTGWWVVLPLLACVWFTAGFAGLRYARRRAISSRR
jgi:hypothetical protein